MFALSLLPMAGEDAAWRDPAREIRARASSAIKSRERALLLGGRDRRPDRCTEAYGTTSASNCLRLMMLTGCRPGEAMRATWAEFADPGFWDKPSAHTKQRKRHRVPLSPAATEFIEQIRDKETRRASTSCSPVRKRERRFGRSGPHGKLADKASVALWAAVAGRRSRGWSRTSAHGVGPNCRAEAARRKIALPVALTDARAYDLRHTFASIGAGGGLSLQISGGCSGTHSRERRSDMRTLPTIPCAKRRRRSAASSPGPGRPAAMSSRSAPSVAAANERG